MSGEHTPLLPCPFCGSADVRSYADTIECAQCDAQGPSMCGRHGWNKRPERDELLEALSELLSVDDIKRQIWTTDMTPEKRDKMLASNDAHRRNAETKARAAIQKARG